jgi:AcrR family transcriptional regulator
MKQSHVQVLEPVVTIPAERPEDAVLPRLRKVPQQARSRAKVARVLEAADRLLAGEGAESLTTTRVAAEAGVSVGSLYQYLPDRAAIIDALAAGYLAKLEALMESFVDAAHAERWPDPVEVLVEAFAALYRDEAGFRALWFGRHLTEETRAADRRHKRTMATGVHRILCAQGVLHDDDQAAMFCYTAFLAADAVMQEAFRTEPAGAADLLDELKTLLRSYLAAQEAP